MINSKTLDKLIDLYSVDKEMLDLIYGELRSFEDYHQAIYEMQTKMKIFSAKATDSEAYREMVSGLDKMRTMNHNRVLAAVNILNRLAVKAELPPLYDGIVSEERPYRRQVADAVLEYVEDVIKTRR